MDDLRRSALYTTNAMVPNTHGFHENVTNTNPIIFFRQKSNNISTFPSAVEQAEQSCCSTPHPPAET
jgi:hypothetical protein